MKGKIELNQVLDPNVMQRVLDSITKATGLRSVLVNTSGEEILVPEGFQDGCSFCQMVRSSKRGYDKCHGSYMRAGREAAKYGEPYIFRCHGGLIGLAAPLIVSEQYIGAIICGQVLMWDPEEFFWIEVAEMNRDCVENVDVLIEKVKELQVISAEKVEAAAYLLFVVANHLMKTGVAKLEHRQEMAAQQAMLGEEILKRKMLELTLKEIRKSSDHERNDANTEKTFLRQVRMGNYFESLNILNKIVADMLDQYGGRPQLFKARILELLVLLSRAAVDDGNDQDEVLAFNYNYMEEASRSSSFEELCFWIRKAVEGYIKNIYHQRKIKNVKIIADALNYIWENYDRQLTLEEIANKVYLSAYYLSHLFKKELGCTVMDCVTKARMEEAKRLLKTSEYNVVQIAKKLGYSDPGHFSRVFKRSEGVPPHLFKSMVTTVLHLLAKKMVDPPAPNSNTISSDPQYSSSL